MVKGRFIVTTGCSGSTLLSDLLQRHPAILSLSEFFATLQSPSVNAFPHETMTGEEFWHHLSTPRPETVSVVRQCRAPEDPQTIEDHLGTPPLLMFTLPDLTRKPERVHEEMGAYVRTLPSADVGTLYSQVFAWFCQRFDRRAWVERSGGSTWFLPDILRCWPDGSYVHLVRDGRDVAVSMSSQRGFHLAVLADDLEGNTDSAASEEKLAAAALSRTGPEPVPLDRFGSIWARQVVAAEELLGSLPTPQVLLLHYEDLVKDPARELMRLVEFFEVAPLAPRRWLRWATRQVERRESAWLKLPEPDRSRLDAACRPGLQLLGYP
jgi:hypothetical protein